MSDVGKKLNELRVCDLKEELENRRLDTVGAKASLVERLEKAMKKEGLDPAKYLFKPGKKAAIKPAEITPVCDETEIKIKEEPLDEEEIEENVGNDEHYDENGDYEEGTEEDEVDQVGTVDDECVIIEDEDVDENEGDDGDGDEEHNDDEEGEEEEEEEEENGETNNHDQDESINLTIGEDEQKLLHDEAPDDKEKTSESKEKGAGKDGKSSKTTASKDDKKSKDDEKSKKKDEKSSDKKETSEHKSSSTKSATQKDDKDKTTSGNAASSATVKSVTSSKSSAPSRNLWVSSLSSLTRASDLKTIFSKYGKVIGAKVVTNTRTPGTRCYGYVTMASASDASRCIDHLHRTELHGRIISVERTRNEIGSSTTSAAKTAAASHADSKKKDDDKKSTSNRRRPSETSKKDDSGVKKDDKDRAKKDEKDSNGDDKKDVSNDAKTSIHSRSNDRSGDRFNRNRDFDREREQRFRERERERERQRQREILSYQKIREERERQRLREREREIREDERRRREIRERQRQEEARLAEERRKLAMERERLEREKAELLRLERERQKLEREKIELERLELKRQQMNIMQSREDPLKRTSKHERYADAGDRKRNAGSDSRFEAPPPPRFDASLVSPRSYDTKKRDDYTGATTTKRGIDDYTSSSKRMEYTSHSSSGATKRTGIDDYSVVPTKRNSDEYSKRSGAADYISGSSSSKRGIGDYGSSGKLSREVEIHHIPTASSSIHKSGGGRYNDADRTSSNNYRRGSGIEDMRPGTNGNKRGYENSSGYVGNTGGGNSNWPSSTIHITHNNNSIPQLKSYGSNGMSSNIHSSTLWQKPVDDSNWRSIGSSQDRYDRTYNERSSGGYPTVGGGGSGMYGGGNRPAQDRYSGRY